jgi:NTP pyrophosphatase (non-canonical NTP hydrolase)
MGGASTQHAIVSNFERELKQFVDAMRYKLKKNAHKGKWEDLDLPTAIQRLKDEVAELEEATSRDSSIEVILEAADVANFAMMVCNIAMKTAVKNV